METKQVIIMRKDLNMRKGKMIAQGAHASMAVFLKRGSTFMQAEGPNKFIITLDDEMQHWIENSFTKICVSVDSKQELLSLYEQAQEAGIICSLIEDAGRTEFDGIPTYTAVAIGPADSDKVSKITGKLKLL